MNPKTKKVLNEQGSQVTQALKWIGGAIFGDADDVLDDMAEKGDAHAPPPKRQAPRPATPPKPSQRKRTPAPLPEVIDVEGFIENEDDE